MKKILAIMAMAGVFCFADAQVIITDGNLNDPNEPGFDTESVLLGFGDNNHKGIILPQTEGAVAETGGNFRYNAATKSVQMWEGHSGGGWIDLTEENTGEIRTLMTEQGGSVLDGGDEGTGAVMGAETSGKAGVLVLESTDKALVLPRVADPHSEIGDPVAGMMVYDTTVDMLAVYNGNTWYYWVTQAE